MKRSVSRAERLQHIEDMLVTGSGYTAPELARALGVSRATIWRDLRDLGQRLPLYEDGVQYFINRHHYVSNVRLSVAESLMLYLAIRHQMRRLTHVPSSMVLAAQKLAVALRHPISDELAGVLAELHQERLPEQERSQVWEALIEGWFGGTAVRITHHKFHADQPAEYEIEPYLFEPAILSEGVYVIGHSVTHSALRTFKVERISRAKLTTRHFKRPANLSVDELLRHAWGIWYGEELTEVRLRFSDPAAARRVCETRWHPSQMIHELPDGGVDWTVQVAGLIELVPWIRGWGPACEVLEPPELRQLIADDMRRAAELYRGETCD